MGTDRLRVLAIASLGLGAALDLFITVEWSFPTCSQPHDGPEYAVFGLVPYEHFSGVSSMVYDFQPALFAANLLLVWAVSAAILLVLARRTALLSSRRSQRVLCTAGLAVAVVVATYRIYLWRSGSWTAVASVSRPPYTAFGDFRPVGITLGRHYDCTPSPFWFDP